MKDDVESDKKEKEEVSKKIQELEKSSSEWIFRRFFDLLLCLFFVYAFSFKKNIFKPVCLCFSIF